MGAFVFFSTLPLLFRSGRRHHFLGRRTGDVGEALRRLAEVRPDLILLDNHLPGLHGVNAIRALKEAAPEAKVLMLTVSEDAQDLAGALQMGADGYLLKTVESDQLCDAIVKVLDGESIVSPEMMTKLVSAFRTRPSGDTAPAPIDPPQRAPGAPKIVLMAGRAEDPAKGVDVLRRAAFRGMPGTSVEMEV